MSKKNICFIRSGGVETIVAIWHNYFEYFAKVFENVFFLDASEVFSSALKCTPSNNEREYNSLPLKFKIVSPKSLSGFKKFLKSHDIVVICAFSETWHDWYIHHYLRRYSIPMVYIHTTSIISNFQYNISKKKILFVRLLSKAKALFYSYFRRFIISRVFLAKVDTFFISEKYKAKSLKSLKRYNNDIVLTNSRFYDTFLSKHYEVSDDYIIFLDSMLPYHKDQARFGYKPIDRELYYKNLNKVLDVIKSILKKEIVVCLHPKYNNDNLYQDFEKRKTVKYKTDEFIAKAELVLFHESSSINSAILYGKKIIQLTGSRFNHFIKSNCEAYQKVLPYAALDIYECTEDCIRKTLKMLKIDQEKYNNFLSNYLISSGQESVSSSVQIADKISRKYRVPKK